MIIRNTGDVKAVAASEGGAHGVAIRVMLGPEEGAPNFVLRHFTLEPGGSSPKHSHQWEHEVYILDGEGSVFGWGVENSLKPGDAIFVPPGEEHQFKAAANKKLSFLCVIPRR